MKIPTRGATGMATRSWHFFIRARLKIPLCFFLNSARPSFGAFNSKTKRCRKNKN